MNIDKIIINDPTTKQPSVSLTLLLVSFVVLVVAGCLQMLKHIDSVSIFLELYLSNIALYFSRKINFNNKTYTAEKAEEIVEKIENK